MELEKDHQLPHTERQWKSGGGACREKKKVCIHIYKIYPAKAGKKPCRPKPGKNPASQNREKTLPAKTGKKPCQPKPGKNPASQNREKTVPAKNREKTLPAKTGKKPCRPKPEKKPCQPKPGKSPARYNFIYTHIQMAVIVAIAARVERLQ